MANPQAEDGHVDIANEIMDKFCRYRIPGEERQVLDAILRKTYGWHKQEDFISLSTFVEMTELKKPNILRAINSLLSKKIIVVIKKDNEQSKVFRFNKDFDEWQPLSKKITLSKKIKNVIKNDTHKRKERNTPPIDNITSNIILIPPTVPRGEFDLYLKMRQRIKKPMLKDQTVYNRFFRKLEMLAKESGCSQADILNQSIDNSWQGIFPIKRDAAGNRFANDNNEQSRSWKEKFGITENAPQP